jgi:hypothetical protein
MKYKLAEDAKPQVTLLLAATALSILLWFIPYAEYLVYPIRLFVTFIHEGSHALMAVITGGSVASLTIASDGSGAVYSAPSSWLGAVLTSSAGYLGTTIFGVMMLYLIRRSVSPHKVLFACGAFVGIMTIVFGILSPVLNFMAVQVPFSSLAFTVVAGLLLTAGLIVLSMYSNLRVASFAVAFLAVQCLLNALTDLKALLWINAPLVGADIRTDAGNMAAATLVPGFVWVILWIVVSVIMITIGLRMFAATRRTANDSVFVD